MDFVNPQLVRASFVNFAIHQLARTTSVNLQPVRMSVVDLLLVRMPRLFPSLCERSAPSQSTRYVSLAALQERLSREECFDSVFTQVTDTQDRLCHLHHTDVTLSQVASDS